MKFPAIISLTLFILIHFKATGQTNQYSEALYANFTVHKIARLQVIKGDQAPFEFKSSEDLVDGITRLNFAQIQVASNVPWIVHVNLSNYPGHDMGKEFGHGSIRIRTDEDPSFIFLGNEVKKIKKGNPGNYTSPGHTFNVDLQIIPGYSPPGIYQTTIIYTLSSY